MAKRKNSDLEELKTNYIHVRCTDEVKTLADRIAIKEHLSTSAMITRMIYAEAERQGIEP